MHPPPFAVIQFRGHASDSASLVCVRDFFARIESNAVIGFAVHFHRVGAKSKIVRGINLQPRPNRECVGRLGSLDSGGSVTLIKRLVLVDESFCLLGKLRCLWRRGRSKLLVVVLDLLGLAVPTFEGFGVSPAAAAASRRGQASPPAM
jgi:hypothetical protein